MKPKRILLAAAVLALLLAAAGTGVAVAQDQGNQAALRAVHAVPGAPPVDVFVDGNLAFANVSYKSATDYAALPAGQHAVRVVQAGAGAQGQALIDTAANLNPGSYNTLVAVGQTNNVQALVLVNDSTLPTLNEARVRVVHASPNAPAVDVAVQGGPVLFQGASFPSATGYRVVDAGTFTLEIRQAGTNNVLRTIPSVTLNGAAVYSIYAVGLLNGQPPLEALVVVDAPPLPACRRLVGGQVAPTARATATPQVTATPTTATPTTGTPTTGTPTTGTPTTGTPTTGTPTTVTPTTGTPTTVTPTTGTPTTGTPATGTPATGTPTTVTPTTGTPSMSVTPQVTASPTGGTPQSASATSPGGSAPVGALLQVGLSLAAVLGGMALSRRLF